jgi:multiple sugar transport system permease protein
MTASVTPSRPRRRMRQWSQVRFGALVLVPVFAWFILFMFVPIVQTFWLSFRTFSPLNLDLSKFVGFSNFADVLGDPLFQQAAKNSLIYVVVKVVIIVPLATVVAVMLARTKHRQFYVIAFFVPGVMSLLASSVLFRFLYNPNLGVFDQILSFLHLPTSNFIYSPDSALGSLIAMDVWKSFGLYTLIVLAGVLQIPTSINEAAMIDGAGPFRSMWSITLPLIRRVISLILVMSTIDAIQSFSSSFALSGYGPTNATFGPQNSMLLLSGLIYTKGIQSLDLGYAATASLVLFIVVLLVTLIQLRITRSDVEY